MTPEEFTEALSAIGWKQSDFCRRAGVAKDTPSRWTTGKTPIPEWVPQYLGMVQEIARLHEAFVVPPKP
jgi:transcriptional regulator with XRE-family HTH domain